MDHLPCDKSIVFDFHLFNDSMQEGKEWVHKNMYQPIIMSPIFEGHLFSSLFHIKYHIIFYQFIGQRLWHDAENDLKTSELEILIFKVRNCNIDYFRLKNTLFRYSNFLLPVP